MKRVITITVGHDDDMPGCFRVEEDGRFNDGLSWDEMLGQITTLTIEVVDERRRRYGDGKALYTMRTQEQWDEIERVAAERRIQRQKEENSDG